MTGGSRPRVGLTASLIRAAVQVALLVLAAWSPVDAQRATRADSAAVGSIVGVVVSRESGAPLSYSVVAVTALGRERFTNERGQFDLRDLPAGPIRVTVRHIGYTPTELTLNVHADRIDTVRVPLTKLAVELRSMTVRAIGQCTNPGPPRAVNDPAFAAVFDQLRENADRYRLLADAYPFAYAMERTSSIHYVGGDEILQRFDTMMVGTGTRWKYAPGTVVERSDDPRSRQVVFNIPTLTQFAERVFLDEHCFANGGADTVDGHAVIRIDFAASTKIRQPDVSGSVYLDRASFQIRRSRLRLTRVPDETPEIATVEVVSEFSEVLPSISLASDIRSIHALHTDRTRPILPDTAYETQRRLRVIFLKSKPGDDVRKP